MKKTAALLAGIAATACVAIAATATAPKAAIGAWGFDLAGMDRSVKPGDDFFDYANGTWFKNTRFAFKTWTGQETELGTLKTYTETRINFGNRNANPHLTTDEGATVALGNPQLNKGITLNFAWVQLGGLRVGKDESAFNTFSGYAGNVIQDTLVPYGGFDTNVVQYYFDAGNGFSFVGSLETGSGSPVLTELGIGTETLGNDSIDSYVPFIVGGVKYTQGWGAITGVIAYDSTFEETSGKVRLDVTPMQNLSLFIMGLGMGGTMMPIMSSALATLRDHTIARGSTLSPVRLPPLSARAMWSSISRLERAFSASSRAGRVPRASTASRPAPSSGWPAC